MERFAFELERAYSGKHRLWKLSGAHWQLIWWLPWVALRLIFTSGGEVVHLMDGVLVCLAPLARLHGRIVAVTIHGLEVTFPNPLYQKMFSWGLKQVHGIVSVSMATQQLVEQFCQTHQIILGEQGIPCQVIGHGTEAEWIGRVAARQALADRFAVTSSNHLILLAGRLVERKGQAWFLEHVAPQLLQDVQTKIVVVGDGPLRDQVRALAEKLAPLPGQVILRGQVSEQELHWWYSASDVMVMANIPVSGDAEGFGLVAVEAASFGCPVVASRLEGVAEAVQNGHTGLLVATGQPQAFIQAIQEVQSWDEERRKSISTQLKQQQSWLQKAIEYQNFFEHLTTKERFV